MSGTITVSGTNIGTVQYTFDDGIAATNSASLYVRPTVTTYPGGRTTTFEYGATGSNGSSATSSWYLNRINNVKDSSSGTNSTAVYTYIGESRIIKVAHPTTTNNLTIAYSLGSSGVYSGLDRFGRIVQQLWKDGSLSGGNYDGYQYTYDRNGNLKSKDYFASGNAGNLDEAYIYDGLGRLVDARRGTLSSGLITSPAKLWAWSLDSQGNWKSYKAASGIIKAAAPSHTRTVDSANEITNISQRAFSFSHFILHPSSFILLHSSSPPTFSSPPDRGPIPVR
jgi:hypothetical protein